MSTARSLLHHHLESQSAAFTETTLLDGVLEEMMDGILVVTAQGQIKYANQSAQEICQMLTESRSSLPPRIWQTCLALLDRQFSQQFFTLEDEIQAEQIRRLRVRVRLIEDTVNEVYLLVAIEDRDRNNQSIALMEAQRYKLTNRETEVWLLKRTSLSYKAIAAKLNIAVDTVKKHLKNIRAKQQVAIWREQR